MAQHRLRRERRGSTLQKTALVHEVYLRLLEQRAPGFRSREHFFGIAGTLMGRILVDHARRRDAQKRGDGAAACPLDAAADSLGAEPRGTAVLEGALADLERFDPQKARVVELRFFTGLSMEEIADALGVSVRTIHREWTIARAWLQAYLSEAI
jgi:RNA polymerase sigma factor (TIGR02999 family)